MEKLDQLTTTGAQLVGSAFAIVALVVVALAAVFVVDAPYERARLDAEDAARRAWIAAVLERVPSAIDASAIKTIVDPVFFGTVQPVSVYRHDDTGAVAVRLTSPDGYNGEIEIAVGTRADGHIERVRVLAHGETPGYGTRVTETGSSWLADFRGRSLGNPGPAGWRLSANGGAIDAVSGATITSDAVLGAVYRVLRHVEHRTGPSRHGQGTE